MTTTRRPLRAFAAALCATAALLALTSCGSSSSPTRPAGNASSGHGAHTAAASASTGPAVPLRPGERFQTVSLAGPYTPTAQKGGTDEYRCFLLDPGLTAPAALTGSQFLPQNRALVHHAILYQVAPEAAGAARSLDARSAAEGWTCFGDDGIGDDAAWIGHWAPGVTELPLRPGLGYLLPAGSLLVVQVHYNLLADPGAAGGSDRSSMRLRLTDATDGIQPLTTAQLTAPIELPCTPAESGPLCDRATAVADVARRFGADVGQTEDGLVGFCSGGRPRPGDTQSCDYPIDQAATVQAVAGHMHLLGRSMRIELNPGRAGAKTLLDVPVYNFDDQGIRALDTPVALRPGDTVRVTCRHDARLRSQLPALQKLPPRYVVWGDGTSDEMCLGLMVVTAG